VNHPSDDIDHATVDLTFIEQMRQQLSAVSDRSVVSIVEEAYQEGQAQQESVLAADLKNYIPTADAGIVTKILNADIGYWHRRRNSPPKQNF